METRNNVMEMLKMIEEGKVPPHEGYALIQKMNSNKAPVEPRNHTGFIEGSLYKAVMVNGPGDENDIEVVPIYPVNPDKGEVQILVKAFSLNFGDLLCVKGLYPTMPEYPFTPGFEVSGIVTKVGEGVKRVKVGDEVIALTDFNMGGHGYILNTKEIFTVVKPKNITFEEACSFPVVYMTIYNVFEKAMIRKGEKILIQTAAGGTGLIAVQMALQSEAEIYATAGSCDKLEYLENMGAHHVINYLEEDFYSKIMELTDGYGVDVVINTLSGDAMQKGLDLLAPGGRYIEIAMTGLKTSNNLNLSKLVDNQIFYSVDFRKLISRQPGLIARYFDKMIEDLESGTIKPTVGKVFDFSEIKEAYTYLKNRGNIGKIVVRVSENAAYAENINTQSSMPAGEKQSSSKDIAIIGISGRFPGAMNVDEFWEVLKSGRECIKEIPKERWDIEKYFDPDILNLDATNCRWGGFLSDIDKFEPMFFNMSGKEAEMSDPQLRIFLEESWKALEDAGYASKSISNSKCGVFVGVGSGDYMSLLLENGVKREPQTFLGNNCSVLAARICYLLNLKGPSVAIDTACSSSLVAIHLGCQSILSGESDMVISGGTFIRSTPDFYISSSNSGMLSPDGKCKAFDNNSNGFVPGEGVGVVILKQLEAALRDKDQIYGVIKGSGINQDGKTNGITAPSTLSQTDLEVSVYKKSGINPETISYIEAHGTGTKLGDPIEIEALTNAFQTYTQRKQFCVVGSVKTNMGHAVMAAGVSSVIKVLLMMKHKTLVPSLNFNKENEHINFQESPFYVNTELKEWTTLEDTPKRAAVSSFGFSGTNAHMVIEEPPVLASGKTDVEKPWYFAAVSANTKISFNKKIDDILKWLKENGHEYSMNDICYTMLVRREHFPVRAAAVVSGLKDLIEKLDKMKESSKDLYEIKTENRHLLEKQCNNMISKMRSTNISEKEYKNTLLALVEMYEKGCEIKWSDLYGKEQSHLVPMPVYPFAGKSYWIPQSAGSASAAKQPNKKLSHPMIGRNISSHGEIKYSTLFTGNEFYLDDHIIKAEKILPGVAYIEIARALGHISENRRVGKIKNIVWSNPIRMTNSPFEIDMRLTKNGNGLQYEIFSQNRNSEKVVHNHGSIVFEEAPDNGYKGEYINIEQIRSRCELLTTGKQFYPSIKERGMMLGESFQVIERTYGNADESLSLIRLNEKNKKDFREYILHPSIMDGALQSALMTGDTETLYVPYSIGEVEIFKPMEEFCYVYTIKTKSKNSSGSQLLKFTIKLSNEKGEVLVAINNFIPRPFNTQAQGKEENILNTAIGAQKSNTDRILTQKPINAVNELTDEFVRKTLQQDIVMMVSEVLRIEQEEIRLERNLSEYGFESLNFNELSSKINSFYRLDIMASIFFEHDTLKSFSDALFEENKEKIIQFYREKEQQDVDSVSVDESWEDWPSETVEGKIPDAGRIKDLFKPDIINIVAKVLRINAEDIKPERNMSEYGFDSLNYNELAGSINHAYSLDLNPAVFFEHQNIASFLDHLFENYWDKISAYYKDNATDIKAGTFKGDDVFDQTLEEKSADGLKNSGMNITADVEAFERSCIDEPIAIIGISGVFPQSEDVEEFWKNLEGEKDLISELPKDRCDWENSGDLLNAKEANIQWGGFIKDVDKFDSLFFGISPKEAQMMDPQQRIFLEVVWKTIEDAGYKVSDFSGTNTGIFAGVATSDYADLIKDYTEPEAFQSTGLSRAVLTNRISYLLNVHGPSEPIDTACSSALVAIHHAIEAMRIGDCDMAIAGGVNLITSPALYISFSKSGMLSKDGRCKTFDKRANGYVRGEGAGAVLLKPLSKAKADGDHIYAVIKGSATNHGGRTSSLTAPNPNAQAELIIKAVKKSGVDPSTITYVEAHGTGTELGDPIEINGLKKAFKHLYNEQGMTLATDKRCGIGSVKTNVGHLETAAAIAGLFKVILAMKNGKIPANLHFTELNPYIKLDETPFYIVNKTRQWDRLRSEQGAEIPRRAGISSFGFGGANAHLVLEEYIEEKADCCPLGDVDKHVILISAKSSQRLKKYAKDFIHYLEQVISDRKEVVSLPAIAYTTQLGREEMDERLAVVTSNLEELKSSLSKYVNGEVDINGLYSGNISSNTYADSKTYEPGGVLDEADLNKAARLWVSGAKIDWHKLYKGGYPKRASLPTYPFAKEKHWIDVSKGKKQRTVETKGLHPLIGSNISTLKEEKFVTVLEGNDFFIRDHVVGNKKVLPGAAYIEMVRAAGEIASEMPVKKLKDIFWLQPVVFNEMNQGSGQNEIFTFFDVSNEELSVKVKSFDSDGDLKVNLQAKLEYGNMQDDAREYIDIDLLKSNLNCKKTGRDCYELFEAAGLRYGSSFRVIQELLFDENQALCCIEAPDEVNGSFDEFVLHPSLLDGAFQTIIGLVMNTLGKPGHVYLPYCSDSVEIYGPIPRKCYVIAEKYNNTLTASGDGKYDIVISDLSGEIVVKISGFFARLFEYQPEENPGIGPNSYEDAEDEILKELIEMMQEGKVDVGEVEMYIRRKDK